MGQELNPEKANTAAPVTPQSPETPKQDIGAKIVETENLPRQLVNCVKNYSGRMLKIQFGSKNISPEFRELVKSEMILRGYLKADAQ